jgi:hypothetical protein
MKVWWKLTARVLVPLIVAMAIWIASFFVLWFALAGIVTLIGSGNIHGLALPLTSLGSFVGSLLLTLLFVNRAIRFVMHLLGIDSEMEPES